MTLIKKYDFVEIEYTGKLKEEGIIFDTTMEKVAKENGIYDKHSDYAPLTICVGENHILKGLEDQLIGKEVGKDFTIDISSENAFGKKDARLIQLIPFSRFRQQKIQPFPGLQLNIDGVFGVVKTVSGGRCLVDFNHPLSGKDLIYTVKVHRIVEDKKEMISCLIKMHFHIKDAEIEINDGSAEITLKQAVPLQEEFKSKVKRILPEIKSVNFTIPEERKQINLNSS